MCKFIFLIASLCMLSTPAMAGRPLDVRTIPGIYIGDVHAGTVGLPVVQQILYLKADRTVIVQQENFSGNDEATLVGSWTVNFDDHIILNVFGTLQDNGVLPSFGINIPGDGGVGTIMRFDFEYIDEMLVGSTRFCLLNEDIYPLVCDGGPFTTGDFSGLQFRPISRSMLENALE